MTEKEKAARHLLYDANYEPSLAAEREACQEILYDYNRLRPSENEARKALLHKLLGKATDTCAFMPPFYCDYGYNIEVGEYFFINYFGTILDGAKVTFGDHVFIGPHCGFYTAGHPLDIERRNAGLEFAYPITVEDNVWIGGGVSVMPGVTIHSGAVIGSGSVVTKDVPANVLAVGNPCRVLRPITEEDKRSYVVPPAWLQA